MQFPQIVEKYVALVSFCCVGVCVGVGVGVCWSERLSSCEGIIECWLAQRILFVPTKADKNAKKSALHVKTNGHVKTESDKKNCRLN